MRRPSTGLALRRCTKASSLFMPPRSATAHSSPSPSDSSALYSSHQQATPFLREDGMPASVKNLSQISQICAENPINLHNLCEPIVHFCGFCDFCERVTSFLGVELRRDGKGGVKKTRRRINWVDAPSR